MLKTETQTHILKNIVTQQISYSKVSTLRYTKVTPQKKTLTYRKQQRNPFATPDYICETRLYQNDERILFLQDAFQTYGLGYQSPLAPTTSITMLMISFELLLNYAPVVMAAWVKYGQCCSMLYKQQVCLLIL